MELYYLMSITDRDRAEDMAALYRDAGLNLVTTMLGRGTATPQQLALSIVTPRSSSRPPSASCLSTFPATA